MVTCAGPKAFTSTVAILRCTRKCSTLLPTTLVHPVDCAVQYEFAFHTGPITDEVPSPEPERSMSSKQP